MITTNMVDVTAANQFTENVLFFGSTGLIGRLCLQTFLDINFYLLYSEEIRSKLNPNNENNSSNIYSNSKVTSLNIVKNIYCINRKPQSCELFNKNTIDSIKVNKIKCKDSLFYLKKEKTDNEAEKSLLYFKTEEGRVKLEIKTFESNPINYVLQKQTCKLNYESKDGETLNLQFYISLFHICVADSFTWPDLLPSLFSNCTVLEYTDKSNTESFEVTYTLSRENVKPLNQITTMISTLGCNYRNTKSVSYKNIDYDLNLELVKNFNNTNNKRLVIVTTFNNKLISTIFSYFQFKLKLEKSLQNELPAHLNELFIIRPGAIAGAPITDSLNPKLYATLKDSDNILKKIFNYKRFVFDYKVSGIRRIRQNGLEAVATDILASLFYRRPGSSLLGYCITAPKVAQMVIMKAVAQPLAGYSNDPIVEIVSSRNIDDMVA